MLGNEPDDNLNSFILDLIQTQMDDVFANPPETISLSATLHPNHTYEREVFKPWEQTTFDVNDTVMQDPAA